MTLPIVQYRKFWYVISAVLVVVGVSALGVWGLSPGIDFTGGSLLEFSFSQPVPVSDLRTTLEASGHPEAVVQQAGENGYLIRTESLNEEAHQLLLTDLKAAHGEGEELRFYSVEPSIGQELRWKAVYLVGISLLLIALYIAWAFRGTEDFISSKKIALLTIMKTAHDVLISIGAFAILAHFFGYEADAAFVAAALTILGYSINDGVVVLDRTRENLKGDIGTFEQVVDVSITQTLARSINTSVTVFLALLAVSVFGGETIRPFALTLMIGVLIGTYSSIFIASPLLVDFQKWGKKE